GCGGRARDVDVAGGAGGQGRGTEAQRRAGDGPADVGVCAVDAPGQAGVGGQRVGDRDARGRARAVVGDRDVVAGGVTGVDGGGVRGLERRHIRAEHGDGGGRTRG